MPSVSKMIRVSSGSLVATTAKAQRQACAAGRPARQKERWPWPVGTARVLAMITDDTAAAKYAGVSPRAYLELSPKSDE